MFQYIQCVFPDCLQQDTPPIQLHQFLLEIWNFNLPLDLLTKDGSKLKFHKKDGNPSAQRIIVLYFSIKQKPASVSVQELKQPASSHFQLQGSNKLLELM
jgi:hypothetical protein